MQEIKYTLYKKHEGKLAHWEVSLPYESTYEDARQVLIGELTIAQLKESPVLVLFSENNNV